MSEQQQNLFKIKPFKCSVSSVLNKDVKQHGKAFMFDGLDDTAWYSDQGSPQTVNVSFDEPIETFNLSTSTMKIQFQGGFVGSVAHLTITDATSQIVHKTTFYPDDINDIQSFPLAENNESTLLTNVKKLSISFEKSSDFFGRIIIYHMELLV